MGAFWNQVVRVIGRGNFADVQLAKERSTGKVWLFLASAVLLIAMFQLVNSGVRVEGDEEGWGKCPFLLLRGEGHHGKDYKSVAHQAGLCLPGKDHLTSSQTLKSHWPNINVKIHWLILNMKTFLERTLRICIWRWSSTVAVTCCPSWTETTTGLTYFSWLLTSFNNQSLLEVDILNFFFSDSLDEASVRFYTAEVALGIHDLHKMGFVHRDIKPENILIGTILNSHSNKIVFHKI